MQQWTLDAKEWRTANGFWDSKKSQVISVVDNQSLLMGDNLTISSDPLLVLIKVLHVWLQANLLF